MSSCLSSSRGEKLSVTTAIIGLLAVGGKTIDSLWDLTTPATKANRIFALALQELKQCRSTVHILYKTLSLLESAQLPFPERGAWIEVDHLVVTLTDTVLAVSELQALCEALILEKQGLLSPSSNVICDSHYSSYERIINGLCSRIRWHSLSMAMMTTILKCPGESDAQNSKAGLERRIRRLISANEGLSERMRNLEDVFDGRVLEHESLPNYSPSTRGHSFWLSQRHRSSPVPVIRAPDTIENAHLTNMRLAEGRDRVVSPFSGYTLADIPVLSILPLPVTSSELVDGNQVYTFVYARQVSQDLMELMKYQAGQGTSRSLSVILGRTNIGANDEPRLSSSSSSTGSSHDSGPVVCNKELANQTKPNKWRFRSFTVRRRWRA